MSIVVRTMRNWMFALLLFATVFLPTVAAEVGSSSPPTGSSWTCPETCECNGDVMSCSHGHRGFVPVAPSAGITYFEFRNCLLDANLPPVPYPNAVVLIIHNCAIEYIDDQAFAPLSNLEMLIVTGNRELHNVSSSAFRNLPKLAEVDLSDNGLQRLPAGLFDRLTSMKRLDLSGQKVVFDGGLFAVDGAPASTLEELSCNGCSQDSVPDSVLSRLNALRVLQLNNNNIGALLGQENSTAPFRNLRQLRELSLDNSGIYWLSPETFHGLDKLETLRIGHNKLWSVQSGQFDELTALDVLELHDNKLTSLLEPSEPSVWNQVRQLQLGHNPWNCDCQAAWIRRMNASNVVDSQDVVCSTPKYFAGRPLFDVDDDEFCPSSSSNSSKGMATAIWILVIIVLVLASAHCYIVMKRRRRLHQDLKYSVLVGPSETG